MSGYTTVCPLCNLSFDLCIHQNSEWQPMSTAPKDCTWIIIRNDKGETYKAHWAEDESGEYQPAFRGWFYDPGTYFREVPGKLIAWKKI